MEYNIGVQIRMNKLFKHNKIFIVAADHRTTIGPQVGLNICQIGRTVAKNHIDGLIIRPSMAKQLADISLDDVTLMMYLTGKLDRGVDHVVYNTVEYSISCGADIICSEFKFGSDGDLQNTYDCSQISEKSHSLGIPHLITTYVRPEQLDKMGNSAYAHACSIAEELGADIIKIGLPDDIVVIRECLDAVSAPLVIAGGTQIPDKELYEKISHFIELGGAGVVLGRNMWGNNKQDELITNVKRILNGK
jgi:DhnA family fructose-bisphosphate aldolase class Ia